ncbi:MAG: hypothetical protein SGARI_003815, partial [Bacillariaceae sp.]
MADEEQPKEVAVEDTKKTTESGAGSDGADAEDGGANLGGSLINASEKEKSHSHALTVSSRRDMEDMRTKPFVIIVAMAAALGGLIFGY